MTASTLAVFTAERRVLRTRSWHVGARTIGIGALSVLTVLDLGGVPMSGVGWVLLVAALLLGVPHGAADVGAPVLTSRGPKPWAAGMVGYAAVAAVVYLLWRLAPVPTLLALLALAVAHFGSAGVEGRAEGAAGRMTGTLALGGLPVALPLALHGSAVKPLLTDLTGGHPDVVVTAARFCLLLVAPAAVVTVVVALRRRQWTTAAEPVLLTVAFALAAPLVAFAAYYGLWHSLRQGVATVDETAVRMRMSAGEATRVVLRRAALPSAAVVAVGVGLSVSGHMPALATGLVLVLCLTVPHSLCAAATTAFGVSSDASRPSAGWARPSARKALT